MSITTIGLPHVRGFQAISCFRLQSCVREDFQISRKISGFWPLSIVTLNFSAIVTYIIVRSSRGPRFYLETCFHSVPVDSSHASHDAVPLVHFELCGVQVRLCCALSGSCVFLSRSYNEEKKTYFHGRTKKQVCMFPKWSRRLGSRMLGL